MKSQFYTRRALLQAAGAGLAVPPSFSGVNAPAAFGAVPSPQQIAWAGLDYYNFLHFTVNTFTDREWGNGDEDPAIFNPTAFDADAICETLRDSGSKGVILTCKHHDGFCLWPTKTTEHSVRHSKFRGGKGDVVKEVSEAAHRHGLKFGVYLSPWDRNQATYGTPQYIELYRRQLRELLTGYGPIFEIWHDGANGGSGYYGGARETRTIDKLHYYDWANTWRLERELQPDACRFSDAGPDIRWVGNEKGIAGDPCWATFTPHGTKGGEGMPGDTIESENNSGTRFGKYWMPAECDVSIRPGWFWHAAENSKVKTPKELFDLYLVSVGRGASFLLNLPPDRRGLLGEPDTISLKQFGKTKREIFERDLTAGAHVEASNALPNFAPTHLLDGKPDTYWATGDAITKADVTVTLPRRVTFNLVRVREAISLGQRVGAFSLEYGDNGNWKSFASGTSIGIARILRSEKPVTTDRVRLRVTQSAASIALSEIALFNQPL
jgi:alpha-L-fucosidase